MRNDNNNNNNDNDNDNNSNNNNNNNNEGKKDLISWLTYLSNISLTLTAWLVGPRLCDSNFKSILFKLILQIRSLGTTCEIALRWMPQNLTNEKSKLVQVLAWCHQATSPYPSEPTLNLNHCHHMVSQSLGHSELIQKADTYPCFWRTIQHTTH